MEENAPVYVVLASGDHADSPKVIYNSVKDVAKFVTSPEGKKIGARFKKFGTPRDARNFLDSSFACTPNEETCSTAVAAEPSSPFSGVNRIQMNEFKKYIDKGDLENFLRLVDTNPRFLVNTGGDVASIVMEGFRYNALHIAAKSGQSEIISKILSLCHCPKFLTRLYGTSEEDVLQRRNFIISSYLNTPDKGNFDTPLHFATKFGKLNVVKELAKHSLLDKTVKNKSGKTALEVACERYNEENKAEVLHEIRLTLEGFYVLLTRTFENTKPSLSISQNIKTGENNLKTCATAGPFPSSELASEFLKKWQIAGKEIKLKDFEKGWEKVGRVLAMNEKNIEWAESWRFLGDELVNLNNEDGLRKVEQFLEKRKFVRTTPTKVNDPEMPRVLDFSILDEPESGVGTSENSTSEGEEDNEEENDQFYDTVTSPEEFEAVLNDSLSGLIDQFATLSFKSPIRNDPVDEEDSDDEDNYCTPPVTPPPIFVHSDVPCKTDNDLFEVLLKIPQSKLEHFPSVQKYVNKLSCLNPAERSNWPGIDSPRHFSAKRSLFRY